MPLVFELPWLLAGLAALPALWWLLRVTPPPVKRVVFPAVGLLHGLMDDEDKPRRTPFWLLLLRILAAAALIIALAGPRFEPEPLLQGEGPLLLVVDNGWASGPVWRPMAGAWEDALRAAQRQGRGVQLLFTAPPDAASPPRPPALTTAGEALKRLEDAAPLPWPTDYARARESLEGLHPETDEAVFIADGLDGAGLARFLRELRRYGRVSVMRPGAGESARLLQPPRVRADSVRARVLAVPGEEGGAGGPVAEAEAPDAGGAGGASAGGAASGTGGASGATGGPLPVVLQFRGPGGELLAAEPAGPFNAEGEAEAELRLPRGLLDRLSSVELAGAPGAGSVQLLAEGDRLRRVLLWRGAAEGSDPQPLLSPSHYLRRAFSLFAEVAEGKDEALAAFVPDMVVTDGSEPLPLGERERLLRWTQEGGVLLRFAGDGLLREGRDTLAPVRLRPAVRSLGGALSWEEPVAVAPEPPEASPLAGLTAPPDLRVSRAVLAEPGPELEGRTWAWLADGSPLLTAREEGEGVLVLLHTAATAEWSSVPISGYFVSLLRRLAELARLSAAPAEAEGTGDGRLEPFLVLDGFGQLVPPDRARVGAPRIRDFAGLVPSPLHPPGLYGRPGAEGSRLALNLGGRIPPPVAMPSEARILERAFGAHSSTDLRPFVLVALLALFLAEFWAGLWLRGLFTALPSLLPNAAKRGGVRRGKRGLGRGGKLLPALAVLTVAGALAGAMVATAAPGAAQAQEAQQTNAGPGANIQETRIVYAITGQRATDEVSFNALRALTRLIAARTSVHLAEPFGVRPGADDLSPYPLLYWPYDGAAPLPDDAAREALQAYLARGGMALLDLRRPPFLEETGSFSAAERAFLEALRLPPLSPVPPDYVLNRSFYLLEGPLGRYDNPLLLASAPDPSSDEVSALFLGTNDWAAAWAQDDFGNTQFALIPGGEAQREQAYRFGVNLVLHALSGSYKADQIHLDAIIERLQE